MHLHILGICGTFMGGIAAIARAAGHKVTGADSGIYPPMSEQLAALDIDISAGYDPADLEPRPDCVVVGNVMSRGNAVVEEVLNRGLRYISGPQWLAENVLQGKWVLAVAGTHGKTTTSSMLAWILEDAGLNPGFLIGGVPANFGVSARNTDSGFFVIEADEYDTAFFDKRSKFVHYRPRTLVINNIEFDHADIFPDLNAIMVQFHQLLRTLPGEGLLVHAAHDENINDLIRRGCWSARETFASHSGEGASALPADWQAAAIVAGGREFKVHHRGAKLGGVSWPLGGLHNVDNALAAIAAARHVGVPVATSVAALAKFNGVARRMQLLAEHDGIRVFDDFAHHPTAIASTLRGLRAARPQGRVMAVMEPRSNTMKMGVHADRLAAAFADADRVLVLAPEDLSWDPASAFATAGDKVFVAASAAEILDGVLSDLRPGDDVVLMSNGGFEGLPGQIAEAVKARKACD